MIPEIHVSWSKGFTMLHEYGSGHHQCYGLERVTSGPCLLGFVLKAANLYGKSSNLHSREVSRLGSLRYVHCLSKRFQCFRALRVRHVLRSWMMSWNIEFCLLGWSFRRGTSFFLCFFNLTKYEELFYWVRSHGEVSLSNTEYEAWYLSRKCLIWEFFSHVRNTKKALLWVWSTGLLNAWKTGIKVHSCFTYERLLIITWSTLDIFY